MKHNSIIKIKVTGKNVIRFIRRIINRKIELLEIKPIDNKTCELKIYEKDYDTLIKIKTIYEIEITEVYGLKKLKKIIKLNEYIISFTILGLIILIFLTNIIFEVEVIHNNSDIRNMLTVELAKYDIKKYKMVRSYKEIEKIKENILKDYSDYIEWLEIERIGTKYTIRVEERIKNKKEEKKVNQHIVSNSNAIIKKIEAESGEVVKNVDDYVKKGDIVISGFINLNEIIKEEVMAKGTIYGEVWYQVKTIVPNYYYEKKYTGKKNNVIVLKIFNHRLELFNFHKYKTKDIKEKTIIKNNLLPISLVKEIQKETNIEEKFYLKEEAIEKAYLETKEKIENELKEKEKIINIKKLQVKENNSKIEVEYFVSLYKNITETKKIEEGEMDVRNNKSI